MNKPEPVAQQALNAQQLHVMRQRQDEIIGRIKTDVELRKWSVDQACGLAGAAFEAKVELLGQPGVDVVKTARDIHKFLIEGASVKDA